MRDQSILKPGQIFIFAITLILINGAVLVHADQSEEVDKYLNMLSSDSSKTRIDASKYISRSGLTDPKLFNFVEKKLLEEYQSNVTDPKHIDEMAWLCKALASSGNEEYRSTLQEVIDKTSSAKLKKYAKQSINLIKEHARKNKIFAESAYSEDGMSPQAARYMSMLKSGEIPMIKDAAKNLYRNRIDDQRVYDTASEVLLEMFRQKSSTSQKTDTMSWLCKALGASGISKYKDILDTIINETSDYKLKSHAIKNKKLL